VQPKPKPAKIAHAEEKNKSKYFFFSWENFFSVKNFFYGEKKNLQWKKTIIFSINIFFYEENKFFLQRNKNKIFCLEKKKNQNKHKKTSK